jgi:hypothetical protein
MARSSLSPNASAQQAKAPLNTPQLSFESSAKFEKKTKNKAADG